MAGEMQSWRHESATRTTGTVIEVDELVLASLVVFALDRLGTGVCCPHSCAACAALVEIESAGGLDDAVRPHIESSGSSPDWWRTDSQSVDWEWVTDRWCDPDTCS